MNQVEGRVCMFVCVDVYMCVCIGEVTGESGGSAWQTKTSATTAEPEGNSSAWLKKNEFGQ